MSTPFLTPYAATWDAASGDLATYIHGPNGRINLKVSSLNQLQETVNALNDAFTKGVETERARCLKAVMGLSVPQCFSARELIEHDVPRPLKPSILPEDNRHA